ncbi:ribose-5-phosphate isomerase [Mycoplasmopsis pullorum]|uniref:RpiB/LacA/LacB family sugar-phosphate isomerase n=1 Tax=Mycoplasmopsis pullorum TaxID=48003 RepID=UPI0011197631|nr:RpiB/LacA/LacB family sugar-phosphate isomerase [Mycoplasmopsis pullorum]TNK82271.1 ribose-5-phosphate isomerase [Mycoplasmopsis pullorum]TNK82424.1 ribose-5-phosphate isomerase [Mycoplasmopsis pullorum]TNK84886.1 ribose-5-phosphate isomerase [Mycoplasmopsis pullorum]TNK85230.1 ribose-5-phosphate isomerase [Mycoplasmopsis pullorum]TNK86074.1 ribose-5-phosphate isomerase [Mycoplasmopsis pullorum]
MNKKVAFASDHAGFKLKQELENYLKNLGYEIVDLGPNTDSNSVSYTLQGNKLADYINQNNPEFGIGICGTGLGISYALNRHKHIRAARITSVEDAHLAKQHNNANVLVFGGRQVTFEQAKDMVDEYLKTQFEGGRHIARIEELDQ